MKIFMIYVDNLKHKWNINDKNLGKSDSTTQIGLLQDVDILSSFHAQNRRGRVTMLLKLLVKLVLQEVQKLEMGVYLVVRLVLSLILH